MDYRAEYVARINRVLDYIETHLDNELSLERLSKVACFSPHHFHRLFGAMMGETLQRFVQRLRLERAAGQLRAHPARSITTIALDNGFASSATFARAFRAQFQMSASAWRDGGAAAYQPTDRSLGKADRKLSKTQHNPGKEGPGSNLYLEGHERRSPMTEMKMTVEIQDRDPQRVAYLRHVGPYQGDTALFGRLIGQLATWAGPRGVLGPSAKFLAVYHDNPEVTKQSKLRLSICVPIAAEIEVGGDIGAMEIAGGRYAVATFRLLPEQYPDAWAAFMRDWLPDSGYAPDDRVCFERYLNNPETDPEGKHDVEIWLPVRPL